MTFDVGRLRIGTVPGAKPNSFQAMSLMDGKPLVLAEFEVYPATGRLLGYKPIAADHDADHEAIKAWIAEQAEHLKSLTAQRQP